MGEYFVIFDLLFVTSSTSAKDVDGVENFIGDGESSSVEDPVAILYMIVPTTTKPKEI